MGFFGVDESRHRLTGMFVGFSGHLAEIMNATVDVAVLVQVIVALALDDTQGLLGSRCVVEIHQRLAIDLLVEDRELSSYFVDIHHH